VAFWLYCMQMRLRLPELLAEHKPPLTPYGVAKASKGRISLTTIYRLNRNRGRVASFDGELLEALCDVFGVSPGELLKRDAGRKKSRGK
jgi:DNA-binding Xre family transcriptional regulator